jgi:hypothetical protein
MARSLIASSGRQTVGDFEIVNTTERSISGARAKLEQALDLIKSHDAKSYERLRASIRRFILLHAGGPEFWPEVRAVTLTEPLVRGAEVPLLAMTIVHELTHARLWDRGFDYRAKRRAQLERICVAAEIRFARRLPDHESLEEFAMQKLKREWWSTEAVAERRQRAGQATSSS